VLAKSFPAPWVTAGKGAGDMRLRGTACSPPLSGLYLVSSAAAACHRPVSVLTLAGRGHVTSSAGVSAGAVQLQGSLDGVN
jgi:hypothetical protein